MFSDLHNKCFGPGNEKLLEAIDKLQPEGIFIPGDVLTAKPGKKLTVSLELLTKLSEKYPRAPRNRQKKRRAEYRLNRAYRALQGAHIYSRSRKPEK